MVRSADVAPDSAPDSAPAVLRPASVEDVPLMQAVEVAAGAPFRALGMDVVADDPPPSTVVLRGFVDRADAWMLTTLDGEAIAYRLDAVVDGQSHLEQVSVDPRWAGHRFGRRLIDDLVEHSRRRGRRSVSLTTYADVPWNAPYYARLGFRVLDDDELGPGLRAIRRAEIARGLDRWPRCAMRRDL